MASITVGLHPHKAAVLVAALRDVAVGFRGATLEATRALSEGLDDVGLAIPLARTAAWADDQADRLQQILDDVMRWELEGRPGGPADIDVWRAPYNSGFDDPRAAMTAWFEARGLLTSDLLETGRVGDDEPGAAVARTRLAQVLDAFAHDPVFAAQLGAALGPERVAALLLVQAEYEQRGRAGDDATRERAALRASVFSLLGVASVAGVLPFGFADLVAQVRPPGADRAGPDELVGDLYPLGLLFGSGVNWGTGLLVDAVRTFVVPLNRAGGDRLVARTIGGVDPRVGVLAAVGRNPDASLELLAEDPFADLVSERFAYGDGGAALASVLAAGTDPTRSDTRARAAANMAAFVVFAVTHPGLPPVVGAQLGVLATPWVSSFRSAGRDDDPTEPNLLGVLTDETRLRFLAVMAGDLQAMTDLRQGELRWAAGHLRAGAGAGFQDS